MQLKPGIGIDEIIFGLKEADIIKLLGKPDKTFTDEEDDDLIYQYNKLRLCLTFLKEEGNKLRYIRCANQALTFNGKPLLDQPIKYVLDEVLRGDREWETEQYEFFDTYFNEESWIVLNVAYEVVSDIEIGVPYEDDGETYKWPK